MSLENLKMPIVIISPPRSGSNALAYYLKDKHKDCRVFSEPDQSHDKFKDFKYYYNYFNLKCRSKNFNVILKIMSSTVFSEYNFIDWNKFTKIKLHRQNIVSQCTSFYIATVNKTFAYLNKSSDQISSQIPFTSLDLNSKLSKKTDINLDLINVCIKTILEENDCHNRLSLKCNIELKYEEIFNEIKNQSATALTPKIENYDEIYQIISKKIN